MEKKLSIITNNFKELPNNIEAEQAVLGSILLTNEFIVGSSHWSASIIPSFKLLLAKDCILGSSN